MNRVELSDPIHIEIKNILTDELKRVVRLFCDINADNLETRLDISSRRSSSTAEEVK